MSWWREAIIKKQRLWNKNEKKQQSSIWDFVVSYLVLFVLRFSNHDVCSSHVVT